MRTQDTGRQGSSGVHPPRNGAHGPAYPAARHADDPADLEAEKAVIGACLLRPDAVWSVAEDLSAEDFASPRASAIWGVILGLAGAGAAIDLVTITHRLRAAGLDEDDAAMPWLLSAAEMVPGSARIEDYATIVRRMAELRRHAEAGRAITAISRDPSREPAEVQEEAHRILAGAAGARSGADFVSAETAVDRTYRAMVDSAEGRAPPVPSTGYPSLDEILGGLHPEYLILGARPSLGKTSLALGIADRVAASGRRVAFFSLEMTEPQLMARLLSMRSGVDLARIRSRLLSAADWARLGSARRDIAALPLWISDRSRRSATSIRMASQRLVAVGPLGLIVVDYLQLAHELGFGPRDREKEVTAISRGLKALSKDLGCPVLCLAQLNRNLEYRSGKDRRPRPQDLRESGSIEADADTVLLLHAEEDGAEDVEVIVGKQRNGRRGTIPLRWHAKTTCFTDPRDGDRAVVAQDPLPFIPEQPAPRALSTRWIAERVGRMVRAYREDGKAPHVDAVWSALIADGLDVAKRDEDKLRRVLSAAGLRIDDDGFVGIGPG